MDQIIDKRTVAIPGPMGDVTPAALAAKSAAEAAAEAAATERAGAEVARTGAESAKDAAEAAAADAAADAATLGATDANVAARIVSGPASSAAVARAAERAVFGGRDNTDPFAYLRAGIENPLQDTRVVCVGSSTMNGGNPAYEEQRVTWRLAYRAGSKAMVLLDSVTEAPAAGGMQWWHGAQGGTASETYLPSDRLAKLLLVKPNFVLHMVGSNDWANGVSTATYKANLQNILTNIENNVPGVVNVLIHQQKRFDITAPSSAWSEYGAAMKQLADAVPAKRVFIDVGETFDALSTGRTNPWGLLDVDKIHLRQSGNRLLADVLGARLGIPSDTMLQGTEYWPLAIPASATYPSNSSTTLASLNVTPASFPRLARLTGSLYCTASGNGSSIGYHFVDGAGAISQNMEHRIVAGITNGVGLSDNIYIPPLVSGVLKVNAIAYPDVTLYVSGNDAFSRIGIDLIAI